MANRSVLLSALVLFAASPVLRSQIPADTGAAQIPAGAGAEQTQQSPLSECSNPLLAPGEDCMQAQQQGAGAMSGGTGGLPIPASLGSVSQGAANPFSSSYEEERMRAAEQLRLQSLPPDLPTEFQKFVAETTGQFLPLYGEDLFHRVPSTFAPSDQTPVPPEYVIGPEDELRVRIWGQVNFSGNLRVDRSGNIYLPQIGTIQVAGLPFSALDQRLRSAVSKLYRNFDLSVDIGQIRSIQVYVSGQARRPGAYTISSLSSLVDALFASGGPAPQGSLRHILLRRQGKTVTDFDLYALLIHGDKSGDVRLLAEDVIYIPPAGPEVAITGSVRTPAIYELRGGETAGDLIEMAGKTTAVASDSRITLERIEQHRVRDVINVAFDTEGLATALADGDILRIEPILPAYDKTVTLRGNVANPGRFSWHPGMRLSDLIPDQDSLVSRDYWWKRSHLGLPAPEFEPEISTLGETAQPSRPASGELTASALQATVTNALAPMDLRRQAEDTSESALLASQSSEKNPNQQGANATIASGVAHTPLEQRNKLQSPGQQIDWDYAVVERIDPQTLKPSLIPFDLGKLVLSHDPAQNLELEPGDTVTIFSQSDIRAPLDQQVKYVELEGEFAHPGFYSVSPGETLRDVVRRAGGLTPRAYLYGSEFTRESTRILQQQRLDDYIRSLGLEAARGTQALAMQSTGSASSDVAASQMMTQQMIARLSAIRATGRIVLQFSPTSSSIDDIPEISLENGDKFVVPFAPANINVVGSVYDQNSYVYQRGRTLNYYVQLAGGPNRNADWRHAFLIRADGSVVSRKRTEGSGFWKQSFNDLKLNPGDTIVVPEKTLRPTAVRGFLEWSQVFSQLAVGAAVVNVL
jgi:polysaccharide export outer membrane protein